MELASQRVPDTEVGRRMAAGRDTAIYEMGTDLVLRRASDATRSFRAEAEAMAALRTLGYPIPRVHRVGPGEMVMDRVRGPTMLDDLARRPWHVDAHARLLADLHARLHALAAPPGLRSFAVPGDAVLHLDLHPGNVILSPDGPVVIDWANVATGPPGADVALTWIVLASFEIDDHPVLRALALVLRRRLVTRFLEAAGRAEAAALLRSVGAYRAEDRNIRPAERAALEALIAANAR